jgi:putative oxidoreductase
MTNWKSCFTSLGLLWLRVLMGVGIAYHGYGKVFGGIMPQMVEGVTKMGVPFPVFFAWAAALSEFAGGILIALGLATRLAALFVLITMSVAGFIVHKADPWNVKELAFAYWTIAGALILTGPGPLSLDALFSKRRWWSHRKKVRDIPPEI